MTNELTVIEGEYINLGEPIDREVVVQFGDTLMGIHPQAKEIGLIGMRTVAQLAMMTGANPMPGTNGIHAWLDNKNKLCIQFGIGFLRGESEKVGGILWVERPRPMTPEEHKANRLSVGQFGSICKGALARDVFALRREMAQYGEKLTLAEAKEEVARVGVGVASTETWNNSGQHKDAKTGRPLQWTADERAERDLLRKLVPILHRAEENIKNNTRVNGGPDWNVGQFANITDMDALPKMSVDEVNDLFFDANPKKETPERNEQTNDAPFEDGKGGDTIDATTWNDLRQEAEAGAAGDELPTFTVITDFYAWYLENGTAAPHYADPSPKKANIHMFQVLKKVIGDDVGLTFAQRATADYVKALDDYANSKADEVE